MKQNIPTIKPEKKNPSTPLYIVIIAWVIFSLLVLLDVYQTVLKNQPLRVVDILCDVGILAVCIYFTVKYRLDKKKNK